MLLGQEAQRIIDWLSPLNFATIQNDTFATRVKGTGEWLLDNNLFKDWLNGANKILWCPGIRISLFKCYTMLTSSEAGAGKTILAYETIGIQLTCLQVYHRQLLTADFR